MKSRLRTYGIISIFLLVFSMASYFVVRPLHQMVRQSIAQLESYVLNLTENYFGVTVQYSSMSPSIVRGISLKNVRIIDAQNQSPVLVLKRIEIQYNIFKLLQGNITEALDRIVLDGSTFTYDETKHAHILEKIISFAEKSAQSTDETQTIAQDENSGLAFLFQLPVTIQLKNMSATYTTNSFTAEAAIKKAFITVSPEILSFDIQGSIKAQTTLLKNNEQITAYFNAQGSADKQFTSSNARIHFTSIDAQSFSLARMSFLFSMTDSLITLNMIQNLLPVQISAQWDLKTQELTAHLDAERFSPMSLITVKKQNDIIKKLRGSHISGSYMFSLNTQTQAMNYTANGSAFLGKGLLPDTAAVSFKLNGTDSSINIRNLHVQSSFIDANATGSFNFKTLTPEGYIRLEQYTLPNGGVIQADLYVDPLDKGFMCFIPQIVFDTQELTAIQIAIIPDDTSIDFELELYDYTHFESDMPSRIAAQGSVAWQNNNIYAQLYASIDTLYLDTVGHIASFFLNETGKETLQPFISALSPYALSNEIYFSTDLKSISFNAPRIVVVNTQKEREFAFVSLSGNNALIDVAQIDIVLGDQSIQGSLTATMDDTFNEILFSTEFLFNTIPYRFQGSYLANSYVTVIGDYGFDLFVNLRTAQALNASLAFMQLPVPLGNNLLSLSLNTSLWYRSPEEWNALIAQFSIEEVSGILFFEPTLSLSGMADNFGIFFDTVIYTDTTGILSGLGGLNWQYDSSLFHSAQLNLELAHPISSEKHTVEVTVSNPAQHVIGDPLLFKNLYISAQADVLQLPFSRIMQNQHNENTVSGFLSVLGTIDSVYIAAQISDAAISLNTTPLHFSGNVVLEDGLIDISNTTVTYQDFAARNLSGSVSLSNLSGTLNAMLSASIADTLITSPIEIKLETVKKATQLFTIPTELTLTATLASVQSNLFSLNEPLTLKIRRTEGRIDFSGGPQNSISGHFLDSGTLALVMRDPIPAQLALYGTISGNNLHLQVSDLYIDMQKFEKLLTFPVFGLHAGIITGSATISGLLSDPTFDGVLQGTGLVITSSDFTTERIGPFDTPVVANGTIIEIKPIAVKTQKGFILVSALVHFDRWAFDSLNLKLKSINNTLIAGNYKMDMLQAVGDAAIDLDITITADTLITEGNINIEKGSVVITLPDTKEETIQKQNAHAMSFFIDLTLSIGQHVEGSFQIADIPIVRGLVTAETPVRITYDSLKDEFSVKGKLGLRGGEVYYIKRSFYIREGRVDLNINKQNIYPIITLRSEIRERDANGKPMRIILSADNQSLENFSPQLSSDPPMSETEIAAILGQIVSADALNSEKPLTDFLISASDIFTQIGIFRNIETGVREFFNFDIFSLRTLFIQNTILGVNSLNSGGKPPTLGNFLDNSTVYIGKYLGSSLYMDSLFHFTYDETGKSAPFFGGLLIQPELGFELTTPFFNIRWSLAPENLQTLFVSNNSITISWRFSL